MKRIYIATLNSLHGFASAFRSEAAAREEIIALLIALPVGLWVAPSAAWYVAMIGVLLVLIAVELLNTAVEKLADHVAPERNPKIGALKDYGFNFGAAAIYGYARAGHTENFNELMNKLPGEDFLGVDLRNGAAFYLANRFIFKGRSKVLNHLTIAAVCRSGDKFGATKFTKLEGDGGEGSDSVEADMDD